MIPYIPQMVQLEAKYRFEVSLAGIKPGDTLADAQRLYDIRELREDEEERFGLYGLFRGKTEFYTDGSGLLLVVYPGSTGASEKSKCVGPDTTRRTADRWATHMSALRCCSMQKTRF